MSPEKKVIGRVILLFWNGSLFWGTCEFSFFFLFLVKIYVLLQHGYSSNMLFWCVLRRMQPWVSWCLELGPSFVSGSPGAAKWILKALSWQRIRGFSFKSLGSCCDVIVDSTCMSAYGPFSLMVPFRSAKNRLSGPMSVVSLPIHTADLWLWDWNFVSDSGSHTINCETGLQRLPNHWPYEGLVHPNPGPRCFSASLHQLNCKKARFPPTPKLLGAADFSSEKLAVWSLEFVWCNGIVIKSGWLYDFWAKDLASSIFTFWVMFLTIFVWNCPLGLFSLWIWWSIFRTLFFCFRPFVATAAGLGVTVLQRL